MSIADHWGCEWLDMHHKLSRLARGEMYVGLEGDCITGGK